MRLVEVNRNSPGFGNGVGLTNGEEIFYHGGVVSLASTKPSSQLSSFNLTTGLWRDISTHSNINSPTLCNHAGFVTDKRYLHLIGGWNGHERTHEIITFDTHLEVWLKPILIDKFPVGGGLSSHTVTPLVEGGALVIGRLGSLRMQRQTATVLKITGNLISHAEVTVMPDAIASRSGHTATVTKGGQLVILGGREDPEGFNYQLINGYNCVADLAAEHFSLPTLQADRSRKIDCRRHHVAFADSDGSLITLGGEKLPTGRGPIRVRQEAIMSDKKLLGFNPACSLFHHTAVVLNGHVYILGGFDIATACKPNQILYQVRSDDEFT